MGGCNCQIPIDDSQLLFDFSLVVVFAVCIDIALSAVIAVCPAITLFAAIALTVVTTVCIRK